MREGHVSLLSSIPNDISPLSFLSLVRCRQVGGGGNDGGGSRTYVASIKANGNAGPLLDFLGHPRGVVDGRWSRSKCLRESGRGCVRSLGRILQNEPSSNQCAVGRGSPEARTSAVTSTRAILVGSLLCFFKVSPAQPFVVS